MSADFLAIPYKETGFLNIADAIDKYLKSNVSKAVCHHTIRRCLNTPPPPPPQHCPPVAITGVT